MTGRRKSPVGGDQTAEEESGEESSPEDEEESPLEDEEESPLEDEEESSREGRRTASQKPSASLLRSSGPATPAGQSGKSCSFGR